MMECNIVIDSTQSISVKNSAAEEVEALSKNVKMLSMFCEYTYIYYVTIYSSNPFQARFLATTLITKTYPVTWFCIFQPWMCASL